MRESQSHCQLQLRFTNTVTVTQIFKRFALHHQTNGALQREHKKASPLGNCNYIKFKHILSMFLETGKHAKVALFILINYGYLFKLGF